ncbi:hypothetical protein [Amycolatopsis mediterranei]|uniref:hypothetical protein n=1 Tax=Amycolatopsis mediterranei TaxID=33910 RepID=UPI000B29978D|nr:hypothetical protein [Amycolatopsis mediterranei]UZF72924.1 hypothetical protein ISP_006321 [Amycolatopsis mediterranei]
MKPRPRKTGAKVTTELIKHLEMIQAVVTRLASNSFLIKGWTLTVSAAFYGFTVNKNDWRLGAMGSAVGVVFWFLDSYYLRQERMYRCLYDEVRSEQNSIPIFSLNARKYHKRVTRRGAFFSTTLSFFYGPIVAVGLILVAIYVTRDSNAQLPCD